MPTALSLRVVAKTRELLAKLSKPSNTTQPEAVPHTLYDAQQYGAAGQAKLVYFAGINADKTLCNMETPGQLNKGQSFEVHRIFAELLSSGAGNMEDAEKIIYDGRAIVTMKMGGKEYGPWPLSYIGSPNVAEGVAAAGAGAAIEAGNFGANGGFPVNGSIIIPEGTSFVLNLETAGAVAISGAKFLRLGMLGVLHRNVA